MSTIDPGTTPRNTSGPVTPDLPPGRFRRAAPRWLVAVVAAVILIASGLVAGVYWASRNDGQGLAAGTSAPAVSVTPPSGAVSTAPSAAASASSATTSAAPSSAVGPARAIPVYYVADVGTGPRLYREFHSLSVLNGSPALTAVTEMLRGTPVDPDYTSVWPTSVRVRSLVISGDLATVDLTGFVAVGAAFEVSAVQQLVYTVTAAEPSVQRVRLLVNGAVPPSGHMDWSTPISRANALETQAFVWILGPTQGATVTSPVTVSLLGTGFEGNVPLKVYQGERVVASTAVTTMMGGFAEAQTTIQLPPGSYEVRAYTDNGRDSSLQLWDSKAFTVR